MTGIIIACGGALIAAFVSILTLFLNRKWQKEDRTTDRLTELSEQIEDLQVTLDSHIKADAENDAKQARRRIIVFSDECRRGMLHSSEHFDSILDDITFYRQYCDDHPKFRNEKAAHSIKYIDDVYDKTKRENAFI
jgi:hypothetical protein